MYAATGTNPRTIAGSVRDAAGERDRERGPGGDRRRHVDAIGDVLCLRADVRVRRALHADERSLVEIGTGWRCGHGDECCCCEQQPHSRAQELGAHSVTPGPFRSGKDWQAETYAVSGAAEKDHNDAFGIRAAFGPRTRFGGGPWPPPNCQFRSPDSLGADAARPPARPGNGDESEADVDQRRRRDEKEQDPATGAGQRAAVVGGCDGDRRRRGDRIAAEPGVVVVVVGRAAPSAARAMNAAGFTVWQSKFAVTGVPKRSSVAVTSALVCVK